MDEVKIHVESLTREALKRGLEVVRWDDHSTMEHIIEVRVANAGGMARELAAQDSDNSNDING